MRSGVSFPLFSPTFSGGSDADFPAANLADLANTRRVFKYPGGDIGFTLPSAMDIGMVAIVQHNALDGATMDITLGSTASGTIAMNPLGNFPATTPYCPAAPVHASSGTITLSGQSWVIGAIVIAGFWSFKDVAVPREIGVSANDSTQELLGADHTTKLFSSRTLSATREAVDFTTEQAFALDFVKQSRGQPFVWVWDADDPTTWANECWLARAPSPDPFSKLARPQGRVSFKFQEHLA